MWLSSVPTPTVCRVFSAIWSFLTTKKNLSAALPLKCHRKLLRSLFSHQLKQSWETPRWVMTDKSLCNFPSEGNITVDDIIVPPDHRPSAVSRQNRHRSQTLSGLSTESKVGYLLSWMVFCCAHTITANTAFAFRAFGREVNLSGLESNSQKYF